MQKSVIGLQYVALALGEESEIVVKRGAHTGDPVLTIDNRLNLFLSENQLFKLGDMIEDYRASVSDPVAGEAA